MRNEVGKGKLDGRRTTVNKLGTISFADAKADCLVLNISTNGAGLALATDVVLPLAFDLEIAGEHLRRHCLTAWRIGRQLGVMFSIPYAWES